MKMKTMEMDMNHDHTKSKIITISSIIGFISYITPYLLNFISNDKEDFKFFDALYAIGISAGFGGVLLGITLYIERKFHYVLRTISYFWLGLSITFGIDNIYDNDIETKWYIFFNLIVAVCFIFVQLRLQTYSIPHWLRLYRSVH